LRGIDKIALMSTHQRRVEEGEGGWPVLSAKEEAWSCFNVSPGWMALSPSIRDISPKPVERRRARKQYQGRLTLQQGPSSLRSPGKKLVRAIYASIRGRGKGTMRKKESAFLLRYDTCAVVSTNLSVYPETTDPCVERIEKNRK